MKRLLEKKRQEALEKPSSSAPSLLPAQIRIQSDLNELPTDIPNFHLQKTSDDFMKFKFSFIPAEGFWKGASIEFSLYHPNFDLQGNICLNILREDWQPVLSLGSVIHGIYFLFVEPNPKDPLNKDVAEIMQENPAQFERNIKTSLRGGRIQFKDSYFDFPRLL